MSSVGGMVIPSAFAVWRLIIVLNLVRPLDRKFARARTLQNLVNESGCPI